MEIGLSVLAMHFESNVGSQVVKITSRDKAYTRHLGWQA